MQNINAILEQVQRQLQAKISELPAMKAARGPVIEKLTHQLEQAFSQIPEGMGMPPEIAEGIYEGSLGGFVRGVALGYVAAVLDQHRAVQAAEITRKVVALLEKLPVEEMLN